MFIIQGFNSWLNSQPEANFLLRNRPPERGEVALLNCSSNIPIQVLELYLGLTDQGGN